MAVDSGTREAWGRGGGGGGVERGAQFSVQTLSTGFFFFFFLATKTTQGFQSRWTREWKILCCVKFIWVLPSPSNFFKLREDEGKGWGPPPTSSSRSLNSVLVHHSPFVPRHCVARHDPLCFLTVAEVSILQLFVSLKRTKFHSFSFTMKTCTLLSSAFD